MIKIHMMWFGRRKREQIINQNDSMIVLPPHAFDLMLTGLV